MKYLVESSASIETGAGIVDKRGPARSVRVIRHIAVLLFTSVAIVSTFPGSTDAAGAQGTAFNYQGRLADNGMPANGAYDFQFKLYDTPTVGTGGQQGTTVTVSNVTVTSGSFTTPLDFGACATCFNGANRFLEIAVKPSSGSTYTTLSPRQPVTSDPYAIRSLNSASADGLSLACVNCITSSQIQSVQGSQVTGLIPVGSVPTGSANYIQNQNASPQAAANFSIAGNGTVGGVLSGNTVNAASQYNIGGSRVLSADAARTGLFAGTNAGTFNTGLNNSFFGEGTGLLNQTGGSNSFFGALTGAHNTQGQDNSFFGAFAGNLSGGSENSFFGANAGYSTVSDYNSFFGAQAGGFTTTGSDNSFFGSRAGTFNTEGLLNSFFGAFAGDANTTGSNNSFFGHAAGSANTTGGQNSFFGLLAGSDNTTGALNTFVGLGAGFNNTTGTANTFVGYQAGGGVGSLFSATAIGANARVDASSSLVLGRIDGAGTNVGIGTTIPLSRLDVRGDVFVGLSAPPDAAVLGGNSLFIGNDFGAPSTSFRIDGFQNTLYISAHSAAGAPAGQDAGIIFRTATSGALEIDRVTITPSGNVGIGTTTPSAKLSVVGTIRFTTDTGDNNSGVCRNSAGLLATCVSARRFKDQIASYSGGLDVVRRLRPVTFKWKSTGEKDLGLVAEEVNQVNPLLTTFNESGEIQGVKYDRVNIVLINAVKEQQRTIESLEHQNHEMKARLTMLEKTVKKMTQNRRLRQRK